MVSRVALFLCLAPLLHGQLPDFYKNVSRITWVVKDLDAAAKVWKGSGIAEVGRPQEVEMAIEYKGTTTTNWIRWAPGRAGHITVDWIQPVRGDNAWSAFLKTHGDGIFSLMHQAPSRVAFLDEMARLKASGAGVLQRGAVMFDDSLTTFAYFDTEARGKYALGLFHNPEPKPAPQSPVKLSQFAFVVKDLKGVSDFWQKLGFPPMTFTRPKLTHGIYRGEPANYETDFGWHRHGTIAYEWIVPPRGPTVYAEYLKRHGEGVQHIGIPASDFDKAVAQYGALGFKAVQSGGWGEDGKPGSGRFAYLDAEHGGGIVVEVLWSYRQ